jgi:hypothetical protein
VRASARKQFGIVGYDGEQNGAVYKITIGRPDIPLNEMGASINARMGLNTWAAFYGNDADAVVAGDVAMLDTEVTPILKSLPSNGLDVVAIHHHMTGTQPTCSSCTTGARDPRRDLPPRSVPPSIRPGHAPNRRPRANRQADLEVRLYDDVVAVAGAPPYEGTWAGRLIIGDP